MKEPQSRFNNTNIFKIIEATPVGICITDSKGFFKYVNPAYCKLYGYSEDELINNHFNVVVPDEYKAYLSELHDKFITEGYEVRGEWEVVRKGGAKMNILADAVLIRNDFGEANKVTFVTDITEIKDKESKLNKRTEELNEIRNKLELKNTRFLDMIHIFCHDLANPLGFILNVYELSEYDKEILDEMYDGLLISIKNAIQILEFIKNQAKFDDDKYHLEIEDFNVKSMIDESLMILKNKIKNKEIELDIEMSDNLSILVERISFVNSVLNNLLTNAIKFSNKGGKIEIRAKELEHYIQLSIKDFGIGIPLDIQENIFNINKSTSRKGTAGEKGIGYGLPLVYTFVKLYGGDIKVNSSCISTNPENHFTEFILSLKKYQE